MRYLRAGPMAVRPGIGLSYYRGLACLGVTAIGWGLAWPAMKLLLHDWPPLFARGVAGCAAGIGLGLMCCLQGRATVLHPPVLGRIAAISLLNVTAWMGLSTLCLLWLKAGEGAIVAYTMPLWATVLAVHLLGERLTRWRVAAIILGMMGVALVVSGQGIAVGLAKLPGIACALGAALLFAFGSILVKRRPIIADPLVSVFWQVSIGSLPLLALGILTEWPDIRALSPQGWGALVYMTIVPMGLCYVTWYESLRHLQASTATLGTLLVPVIGVLSSSVLIGEPVGLIEIAATALTIFGVGLGLTSRRA